MLALSRQKHNVMFVQRFQLCGATAPSFRCAVWGRHCLKKKTKISTEKKIKQLSNHKFFFRKKKNFFLWIFKNQLVEKPPITSSPTTRQKQTKNKFLISTNPTVVFFCSCCCCWPPPPPLLLTCFLNIIHFVLYFWCWNCKGAQSKN
jgi:hypothetical protein